MAGRKVLLVKAIFSIYTRSWAWQNGPIVPELRSQRQEELQSLLAGQSSQISEPQILGETLSNKMEAIQEDIRLRSLASTYSHMCKLRHEQVHIYTYMHTCVNMSYTHI